jgi:hypothetical protein
MEQVKIFRSGSYSTDFIQNEINNFLKENKNKVYITHIKQSESEHHITICLFYEDEFSRDICFPNETNEFVGKI